MRNDYKHIIRSGVLLEIIKDLTAQAGARPTLRSCYYVLLDRGLIVDRPSAYDKLNKSLTEERDADNFPYRLLSPTGGESYRGHPPDELKEIIAQIQSQNIEPELIDGKLKAVLIEKIGLVDTIRQAVEGKIPVGSPGGMVRKEWAVSWLDDLKALCADLHGELVEVIYLGDFDEGGANIESNLYWYENRGVSINKYAVTKEQLLGTGHDQMHIDGYIASVRGPELFGQELRRYLGLSDV